MLILTPSITHAGQFGNDGDTALALQVDGVHHTFGDVLVFTKNAALVEHGVHEGGFAVIDMGDDGDVAN